MVHHILVAVDGSPEADLALAHAIELAHGQNARLTALTTVARPPWLSAWGLAQAGGTGWLKDSDEVAENVSRSARERVPSHISVTGVVTRHSLRRGLVEQIRSGQYDLVVIASHRHGGLRSCVRALGRIDVTHHIAKHGQVAVLTVSPEAPGEASSRKKSGLKRSLAQVRPISIGPPRS